MAYRREEPIHLPSGAVDRNRGVRPGADVPHRSVPSALVVRPVGGRSCPGVVVAVHTADGTDSVRTGRTVAGAPRTRKGSTVRVANRHADSPGTRVRGRAYQGGAACAEAYGAAVDAVAADGAVRSRSAVELAPRACGRAVAAWAQPALDAVAVWQAQRVPVRHGEDTRRGLRCDACRVVVAEQDRCGVRSRSGELPLSVPTMGAWERWVQAVELLPERELELDRLAVRPRPELVGPERPGADSAQPV